MANELCKPIKKTLASLYGHKNVSVKNGTGTAWGWVQVRVEMPRPHVCPPETTENFYCKECQSTSRESERLIRAMIRETLKNEGKQLYTYSDDMGGENEEMLVDVIYK